MRKSIALAAVLLAFTAWTLAQTGGMGANQDQGSLLAGPIVQQVTDNSATIWWETSGPAETIVKYGIDPNNLTQTKMSPFGERSHKLEITGLQPNTTYYFAVEKRGGERLTSGSFFKTEAPGFAQSKSVRITNGPVIEFVGDNSAVVAWSTNVPSSSIAICGTDMNNMTQRAEAEWGSTTHRVTVKNLQPNTTYYFQVQSGQAQGTGTATNSQTGMFKTVAQGQPPIRTGTR